MSFKYRLLANLGMSITTLSLIYNEKDALILMCDFGKNWKSHELGQIWKKIIAYFGLKMRFVKFGEDAI